MVQLTFKFTMCLVFLCVFLDFVRGTSLNTCFGRECLYTVTLES